VQIHGTAAHEGRVILPGDAVRTGPDSEVVYAMGTEAELIMLATLVGRRPPFVTPGYQPRD